MGPLLLAFRGLADGSVSSAAESYLRLPLEKKANWPAAESVSIDSVRGKVLYSEWVSSISAVERGA